MRWPRTPSAETIRPHPGAPHAPDASPQRGRRPPRPSEGWRAKRASVSARPAHPKSSTLVRQAADIDPGRRRDMPRSPGACDRGRVVGPEVVADLTLVSRLMTRASGANPRAPSAPVPRCTAEAPGIEIGPCTSARLHVTTGVDDVDSRSTGIRAAAESDRRPAGHDVARQEIMPSPCHVCTRGEQQVAEDRVAADVRVGRCRSEPLDTRAHPGAADGDQRSSSSTLIRQAARLGIKRRSKRPHASRPLRPAPSAPTPGIWARSGARPGRSAGPVPSRNPHSQQVRRHALGQAAGTVIRSGSTRDYRAYSAAPAEPRALLRCFARGPRVRRLRDSARQQLAPPAHAPRAPPAARLAHGLPRPLNLTAPPVPRNRRPRAS